MTVTDADRDAGPATTRERLLDGARSVIEEGGYGAASVLAITQRSGVAAGTLYRHFPSKEELFVEVFRAVCGGEERAMRRAADAMGPDASAAERLVEVLATFARRALRNPRLTWALIAEPVDPRVDAERIAYRARYTGVVAEFLQSAIAAEEIERIDVGFTAAAIVGGCGEALVGPLAPGATSALSATSSPAQDRREVAVASLTAFVRRAIGAPSVEPGLTEDQSRT